MKELIFTFSLFLTTPIVLADMDHGQQNDMASMHAEKEFMHHQNDTGTLTEADQAYTHINHTMHEGMMINFTGDPDIDFLNGMIPHHQGAIEMAKVQLAYGRDGLLKSFTQKVIRDQNREIAYMKRHLAAMEKSQAMNLDPHSTLAFEEANKQMHHEMRIDFSGNADMDFVNGMIPHHQGAVEMAKIVLLYGDDAFSRRLANEIINAQSSEIYWLKRWKSRRNIMRIFH